MKRRSVYGLSIVALILSSWVPALINALGGSVAFAQASGSPPKHVSTIGAQAERGGNVANIPPAETYNGWRLVGTAVMDDRSESFAIMEYESTGGQGIFKEGDRFGEIRIKKILPDGIVIQTGKGEEMLAVSLGGSRSGMPPSQREELPEKKEVDSRSGDPTQFLTEIRVRRHSEDGQKPSGLLISYIKPDSIFSRIGLKNGDLIVAVNGSPLTTQQAIVKFYDALKAGGTISLRIKQGGNIQDLRLEIR